MSGTVANWISVNIEAMSIDRKPRTELEKTAAEELTAGKEAYELDRKHSYRPLARIPLGTNCIGCHDGMFSTSNKSPSWAGTGDLHSPQCREKVTRAQSSTGSKTFRDAQGRIASTSSGSDFINRLNDILGFFRQDQWQQLCLRQHDHLQGCTGPDYRNCEREKVTPCLCLRKRHTSHFCDALPLPEAVNDGDCAP